VLALKSNKILIEIGAIYLLIPFIKISTKPNILPVTLSATLAISFKDERLSLNT
jgi:hypothetical protein